MIKYFNTVSNERGDVLANYRVQVVDSLGASVDIFADAGGTRFTDSGGNIVNYTEAQANGRVAFYWTPADGQVLQTLDASGNLVDAEADFANAMVLENLPGNIGQDAVTGLVADLAAKADDAATTAALGTKAATADLASTAAGKGAALVADEEGGTVQGSLNSLRSRNSWKSLRLEDYDATGGTDYQAAWDAVIAALDTAGGGVIELGKATYPMTGKASIDKPNISIFGQGEASVISAAEGFRLDARAAGVNLSGIFVRDFAVERTGNGFEELTSTAVSGDTFTVASHGLATGWEIVPQSSVNGLTAGTVYYTIRVDANSFKLATSLVNADAGTAVALTGTTNTTFRFYEVGAFEVIGDDTTSPQRALIRSKIDNVMATSSTANGFVFRAGGYQYDIGRIGTVLIARRPLFVDTGPGGNTAWNGITITHLELRNGGAGRTNAVTYTERDSILRTVRNITIGNLIVQGGAGLVLGRNCQAVEILNIYTELARSPDHNVDIVIGETGRAVPIAIRIGSQRYSDGTDAIGRSGKDHAIKLIRGSFTTVGNIISDGYAGTIIQNAADSASLVTGTYGAVNGATAVDVTNRFFVPGLNNSRMFTGSTTTDLGSIAAGSQLSFTIPVTGAVPGAFCRVGMAVNLTGLTYSAQCRTADTVEVTFANNTGAAVDLPNATYRVVVENHALYF